MHTEHLNEYKQRLLAMRQQTLATLADLELDLGQSLQESLTEFSLYDNHPADIASETHERGKDMALREDQQLLLLQLDAALARIEQGEFGRCSSCGQEIPEQRLQALPFAEFCLDCQTHKEQHLASAPSEQPVNVLYRQSFTDNDVHENVGFDGEDTWQAVARYGTSNTPGDFRQVSDYDHVYIDADEPIGIVFGVEALPEPERDEDALADPPK